MNRVIDYRANKILYNFILSNRIHGKAIVPANLCHSVVDTLHCAGMDLVFVDISDNTLCIDYTGVINNAADASLFLFVHSYGLEIDCPQWFSEVRERNPHIAIIDDRCLCMPQLFCQDSLADLVLYSFCAKKQVDLGVGGIGFLSNRWDYQSHFVQPNACLTNQSWVLDEELILNRSQCVLNHKKHINSIYTSLLPRDIQMSEVFQQWRFNIIVPQKEIVLRELFAAGLFASSHYRSLSELCTSASHLHSQIINLFNDFYFTEEQAIKACRIINKILM